jgi:Skp family chaperone for outer membrane proteins
MKKILLMFSLLSLLALVATAQTPRPAGGAPTPPAATQPVGGTGAEGKIAIINSSLFDSDIGELKAKFDALSAEVEPKRKDIEADQNKYNTLKNDIQTKGGTVTQQIRDQWVEQATELEKTIKRKIEDYEPWAQKRIAEATQATYGKISEALSKYATAKGIAIVIDGVVAQQQRFLLYALPTTDITADFIKEYNAKNPAPASAAPAKK